MHECAYVHVCVYVCMLVHVRACVCAEYQTRVSHMLGKHVSTELQSYPQLVAFKSTKGTKATETGEMYPSEREERNRTAECRAWY